MSNLRDSAGVIHIGTGEQPVLRRIILFFGLVFAVLFLAVAYPFIQMIDDGRGDSRIISIFIICIAVCVTVIFIVIRYGQRLLARKPYLILKTHTLVYSPDGNEVFEFPWATLNVTYASEILFQVTVVVCAIDDSGESRPSISTTLVLDVPLDAFQRPGAEIVKLLTERVTAARAPD